MKIVERNSGARLSFASLALVLAACAALAFAAGCSNFNTNGDDIQGSPASPGASGGLVKLTYTVTVGSPFLDMAMWYAVLFDDPTTTVELDDASNQAPSSNSYFSFTKSSFKSGITYSYETTVYMASALSSTPDVAVSVNGGASTAVPAGNITVSDKKVTIAGTVPINGDTTFALSIIPK